MDGTATLVFDLPLAPAGSTEPLPSGGEAMPTPSDLDLIDRVARRDADAFAALYARHSRPVFGMLVRLAGRRELAEEWLQETFTRVWLAAATHDAARGAVRAWIFRIALNTARSELARKRYRTAHVSLEQVGLDLAGASPGERDSRPGSTTPAARGTSPARSSACRTSCGRSSCCAAAASCRSPRSRRSRARPRAR